MKPVVFQIRAFASTDMRRHIAVYDSHNRCLSFPVEKADIYIAQLKKGSKMSGTNIANKPKTIIIEQKHRDYIISEIEHIKGAVHATHKVYS